MERRAKSEERRSEDLTRLLSCKATVTSRMPPSRVVLALGSNLGNRAENLRKALVALCAYGRVEATSRLYDTAPQYVAEQPRFLNAAVEFSTELSPIQLLRAAKDVERRMGRQLGNDGGSIVRFGPRPIDIDLLFARSSEGEPFVQEEEELTLPHPRIAERAFVLQPLADLDAARQHCVTGQTVAQQLRTLAGTPAGLAQLAELRAVCPLRTSSAGDQEPPAFVWGSRTYLMGVINTTPDSFSDGGAFGSGADGTTAAVAHGVAMAKLGVDVLDIGGHSTKPGFQPISEQEEVDRVAAVVRRLRSACDNDSGVAAALAAGSGVQGEMGSWVALSVDTFRPAVARVALAEGADIVNDVSGGLWSGGEMYRVVAEHGVPLVVMDHGTDPVSLHAPHHQQDGSSSSVPAVVDCVAKALQNMSIEAAKHGVARWQMIVDPGLGFAKNEEQNLDLLRHLPELRAGAGNMPLLLGPSRKRFTGAATWHSRLNPSTPAPFDQRDWATAGVCAAGVASGAVDIVRIHNEMIGDAIRAADAFRPAVT